MENTGYSADSYTLHRNNIADHLYRKFLGESLATCAVTSTTTNVGYFKLRKKAGSVGQQAQVAGCRRSLLELNQHLLCAGGNIQRAQMFSLTAQIILKKKYKIK